MAASRYVFSATDAPNGTELWVSDGTASGTTLLKNIRAGSASSSPYGLTAFANGQVLFSATDDTNNNGLWITDGTAAGTRFVIDVGPNQTGYGGPGNITSIGNGRAVFTAQESSSVSTGLWITDGTANGTSLLARVSVSGQLTSIGAGRYVFLGNTSQAGYEPWVTDGTVAGTHLIKDIYPGSTQSTYFGTFAALGDGRAVFQASDIYGTAPQLAQHGVEPWITDGTLEGTHILRDIVPGSDNSKPHDFTSIGGGKVIFAATDASTSGTGQEHGEEIWVTDGSEAGTKLLLDINPGTGPSTPLNFTALGNGLAVFNAYSPATGRELWVTDGTIAGTRLVLDIRPGTDPMTGEAASSFPSAFTSLGNGTAVFNASDDSHRNGALWITDGTAAGTHLVKSVANYGPSFNSAGDGRAFFLGNSFDGAGYDAWVTDGTAAGTFRLVDLPTSSSGTFDAYDFTPVGSATATPTPGDDTLTGSDGPDTIDALAGNDVVNGLGGNDTPKGGVGNDTVDGGTGVNVLDGGPGDDTAVFAFSLTGATLTGTTASGAVTISGPNATNSLSGFEHYRFSDGQVDQNDGAPLVDDLFYAFRNKDVFAAKLDPDAHYNSFGWKDGRDPNAFFSTNGYLGANQDVKAAVLNPLQHYDQFGWRDGRDPSASFDTTLYLQHNADVKAAGIDPLFHFLAFGQAEGRQAYAAIGRASSFSHGSFDAEFYLLSNPDVAKAAPAGGRVDEFAFQHYQAYGWHEGRNPNAFFDVKGYLNAYADVKAANIDPLGHYDTFGWKDGRDPSGAFDTKGYASHNADVAAAQIDPLLHYLQYGAYENRSTYADGTFFHV